MAPAFKPVSRSAGASCPIRSEKATSFRDSTHAGNMSGMMISRTPLNFLSSVSSLDLQAAKYLFAKYLYQP
jgi:hypothetical protein